MAATILGTGWVAMLRLYPDTAATARKRRTDHAHCINPSGGYIIGFVVMSILHLVEERETAKTLQLERRELTRNGDGRRKTWLGLDMIDRRQCAVSRTSNTFDISGKMNWINGDNGIIKKIYCTLSSI